MSDLDRVILRRIEEKLDRVLELLRAEPVEKYVVIDGELRRLIDDAPPGAIRPTPGTGPRPSLLAGRRPSNSSGIGRATQVIQTERR